MFKQFLVTWLPICFFSRIVLVGSKWLFDKQVKALLQKVFKPVVKFWDFVAFILINTCWHNNFPPPDSIWSWIAYKGSKECCSQQVKQGNYCREDGSNLTDNKYLRRYTTVLAVISDIVVGIALVLINVKTSFV